MKELNARLRKLPHNPILVISKGPGTPFATKMELGNDRVWRDVTLSEEMDTLSTTIAAEHDDMENVCKQEGKPYSFVLVGEKDEFVTEVKKDGTKVPFGSPDFDHQTYLVLCPRNR